MSTGYQSLYRKYRPATFSEIIGQRHVTQTLANAVSSGRTSHAYLFCGPRGTGKTTTARVLAMALNCEKGPTPEPCENCGVCEEILRGACLDVIEFDAASHRGVDDIEELRHRFQFSPGQARYKVYIIDEVHQLSEQAFDMLLKVLEEPPPQVVFILATTEAHKVKPTILSRCQRFDFHRISPEQLQKRLRFVCDQEGLNCDDQALSLLAQAADGAARDALSLLEQASAFAADKITVAEARAVLGGIDPELLINFAEILVRRQAEEAFSLIDRVVAEGKDLVQLIRELLRYLRDLLVIKISDKARVAETGQMELSLPQEYLPRLREQARRLSEKQLLDTIDLLCRAEGEIRTSGQQRLILELFAARACGLAAEETTIPKPAAPITTIPTTTSIPTQKPSVAEREKAMSAETAFKPESKARPTETPAISKETEEMQEKWPLVLEFLRKNKHFTVCSLAEIAGIAEVSGNVITLTFGQEFSQAEMNKPERRELLEKAIEKVIGKHFQIEGKLRTGQGSNTDPDSVLSQALSIFPGSELI